MDSLPLELLWHIFSYLPLSSLACLSQVNSYWRNASQANQLWKPHALSIFKHHFKNSKSFKSNFNALLDKKEGSWYATLRECVQTNWFNEYTNLYKPVTTYGEILCDPVLRGFYAYGFEKPCHCNDWLMPALFDGADVIAYEGEGKTTCALLYSLQLVATLLAEATNTNNNNNELGCVVVVVTATKEKANATYKMLTNLGDYLNNLKTVCLPSSTDLEKLEVEGFHILVSTAYVLSQFLYKKQKEKESENKNESEKERNEKELDMKNVRLVVMENVDEMSARLDEDIVREIIVGIRNLATHRTQLLLNSGDLTTAHSVAKKLALPTPPIRIRMPSEDLELTGMKQFYVQCDKEEYKFEVLLDLLDCIMVTQAVIYCNSERQRDWLVEKLAESAYSACKLPEEIQEFRTGAARLGITCCNAGRHQIDVRVISVIINYSFPLTPMLYIQRVGIRPSRYGRKGLIINFITLEDVPRVQAVISELNTDIEELPADINDLMY